MNVAIGQGDVLVTPLQLANAYATFANGGTLYRPSLVLRVTAPPAADKADRRCRRPRHVVRRLQFPPGAREAMLAGFAGVTTASGRHGDVGVRGLHPATVPVAGKTGTAQVGKDRRRQQRQDTSLFAGFGPVDAPQYTGVTVIEGGGFGSDAAAPVVRNIFEPHRRPTTVARRAHPAARSTPKMCCKVQKNLAASRSRRLMTTTGCPATRRRPVARREPHLAVPTHRRRCCSAVSSPSGCSARS